MKRKTIVGIGLVCALGFSFALAYNVVLKKKTPPEDVVKTFASSLSEGDCQTALELSTWNAEETVNAIIDAGCDTYESSITAIECTTKKDSAFCSSYEVRGTLGEMKFDYDLVKVKGKWKVCEFKKDMQLDE